MIPQAAAPSTSALCQLFSRAGKSSLPVASSGRLSTQYRSAPSAARGAASSWPTGAARDRAGAAPLPTCRARPAVRLSAYRPPAVTTRDHRRRAGRQQLLGPGAAPSRRRSAEAGERSVMRMKPSSSRAAMSPVDVPAVAARPRGLRGIVEIAEHAAGALHQQQALAVGRQHFAALDIDDLWRPRRYGMADGAGLVAGLF